MAGSDVIKDAFNVGTSWLQKNRDRKAVQKQRAQNLALINGLDYQPMYASETVPTYQKTQSPVARSYLESFLMGNNPSSTFSGAPNAALKKQQQQTAQNAMFGTPEQRVAQQRQADAATPWKVQTPTRQVVGESNERARTAAAYPNQAAAGATDPDLIDALKNAGVMKDDGTWRGMGDGGAFMPQLLKAYGGDQDELAEDIRNQGWAKTLKQASR